MVLETIESNGTAGILVQRQIVVFNLATPALVRNSSREPLGILHGYRCQPNEYPYRKCQNGFDRNTHGVLLIKYGWLR